MVFLEPKPLSILKKSLNHVQNQNDLLLTTWTYMCSNVAIEETFICLILSVVAD